MKNLVHINIYDRKVKNKIVNVIIKLRAVKRPLSIPNDVTIITNEGSICEREVA